MFSQRRREQMGVLILIVLSLVSLLLVFWLKEGNPVIDSAWETDFAFATSTPKTDLFAEEGWWDEMATKKPSALPTMPEIDLLDATPSSGSQVAPPRLQTTPTRTPLFDVNETLTPTPKATKDK